MTTVSIIFFKTGCLGVLAKTQFIISPFGDSTCDEQYNLLKSGEYWVKYQWDTINFEDAITEAQEELAKAKVNNGLAITDRGSYVQVLLNKKNKLTTAEENLEGHKAKLSFLEETLKSLEAEESPVEQAA